MSLPVRSTLAWLVLAAPANAQRVLHVYESPMHHDGLGPFFYSLDCAGDVDGDGVPDCVVGIQNHAVLGHGAGVVVVSCADGTEIQRGESQHGVEFAHAVAHAGDLDGDGFGDFLIGTPAASQPYFQNGRVECVAGVRNERLWSAYGSEANAVFGLTLAALPDLDGDGTLEVAVYSSSGVHVYSSLGGAPVFTIPDWAGQRLGHKSVVVGDQNGDSVDDLLLAADWWWPGVPAFHDGCAVVCSGASGEILRVNYEVSGSYYGYALAPLGDLDGGGVEEYLVGASGEDTFHDLGGAVYIYRGEDGSRYRSHYGWHSHQGFGNRVCRLGDLNGDGVSDYAITDSMSYPGVGAGRLYVYCGLTGDLLYYLPAEQMSPSGYGVVSIAQGIDDLDGDGYGDIAVSIFDNISLNNVLVFISGFSEIGEPYCSPGAPNSTGEPGTLRARGSEQVSLDWFQLEASSLPPGQFCLFLMSQVQAQTVPVGSVGTLCLGGNLHRLTGPKVIGSGGEVAWADGLDPSGILAGEAWNFQVWYRDASASTSNFTDATSILFR